MARREKVDRGLNGQLDEFERRLFVLKIEYERYFSGAIPIEPAKERDDLRREVRELTKVVMTNSRQKFRWRTLRARFSSIELYWTRNLVMIERGTHPKMRFRADLHERERAGAAALPEAKAAPKRAPTSAEREEEAYQAVYERFMDARGKCGQSTDLSYDAIRDVLHKQVRTIKSRYHCKSVKFRVTVEDGKAKVKAVPLR